MKPLSVFLQNEDEAYRFLEQIRWPDGPICPHCRESKVYRFKARPGKRRLLKCAGCRKQFSVTVGTIFEDSHIPLTKWLTALHLFCASKKGMSAHQLHRMLGLTYKSAWFMMHRIRHAITQFRDVPKLTGIVEADETYVGGKVHGQGRGRGVANKTAVFALVQRGGAVRSFTMPRVTAKNLKTLIRENVDRQAQLMTDSFKLYRGLHKEFASHETVNRAAKEYVRGSAHVNTAEGYFSLLKRGIIGTYHHVGSHHLHRYLAEFDFRYNARKMNDAERTLLAVKNTNGKRLEYKWPNGGGANALPTF